MGNSSSSTAKSTLSETSSLTDQRSEPIPSIFDTLPPHLFRWIMYHFLDRRNRTYQVADAWRTLRLVSKSLLLLMDQVVVLISNIREESRSRTQFQNFMKAALSRSVGRIYGLRFYLNIDEDILSCLPPDLRLLSVSLSEEIKSSTFNHLPTSLETLSLAATQIKKSGKSLDLSQLPGEVQEHLRNLVIRNLSVGCIPALPELIKLDIEGSNDISLNFLPLCTSIRQLYIGDASLSGVELPPLLTELILIRDQVTPSLLNSLPAKLVTLRLVDISSDFKLDLPYVRNLTLCRTPYNLSSPSLIDLTLIDVRQLEPSFNPFSDSIRTLRLEGVIRILKEGEQQTITFELPNHTSLTFLFTSLPSNLRKLILRSDLKKFSATIINTSFMSSLPDSIVHLDLDLSVLDQTDKNEVTYPRSMKYLRASFNNNTNNRLIVGLMGAESLEVVNPCTGTMLYGQAISIPLPKTVRMGDTCDCCAN